MHSYRHSDQNTPRHTARAVVIKDANILLIERWRDGIHYFSIPGGGIESGETPDQAAEREVLEETSVKIKVLRVLYEMDDPAGHSHKIFLCKFISGEPSLQPSSEEADAMMQSGQADRYEPRWISIASLEELPFEYWTPIAKQLIKDLKLGWSKSSLKLHSNS